jgi:Big-like domain-containing protein
MTEVFSRRLALALASLVLMIGCASMGAPPGGPPDKLPPVLITVTPDSGALRVGLRQTVIFRFDEVINERTKAGMPLEQGIVVSPTEGPVSVDWHRTYITIRNRKGWRPDLAYTVTILSGLQDLSGNATRKPLQTVFSTGSVIPSGEVRGIAFDWAAQQVASGARVEAMIGNDTTLKFVTVTDSTGHFVLTTLPPGTMRVRAFVDANQNRVLDPRELWDSTTVGIPTDTLRHEFYMFAHDTIGPSLSDVTAVDTMTLRIRFDRPVLPGGPLDASQFSLKMRDTTTKDSVPIAIRRVSSAARFDTLMQQRKLFVTDSTMRADTSAAGRKLVARQDSLLRAHVQDSISSAQQASVRAARDTIKKVEKPKPSRAAPLSEFIVELGEPLPYDEFGTLSVKGVVGLTGHIHTPPRTKQFVLRRPPKPPAKDSAAVKKP